MANSSDVHPDWLTSVVESLQSGFGADVARERPPVHLWNPSDCKDISMEIRADGTWWHEGDPIKREKLVRLFASILRKDPDGIYLVTPHEKVIVHVEDAPFMVTRIDKAKEGAEQTLAALTNVGDVFVIDADHPIRVETDDDTGEPRPYVMVRDGLEARIARAPFYDLVNWAQTDDESGAVSVMSAGSSFALGSAYA